MLRKLLFLLFSSSVFASNNFSNEDSRKDLKRQLATYKQEQAKKFHTLSQSNPTTPAVVAKLLQSQTGPDFRKRTYSTAFPTDGYYSSSETDESETSE